MTAEAGVPFTEMLDCVVGGHLLRYVFNVEHLRLRASPVLQEEFNDPVMLIPAG